MGGHSCSPDLLSIKSYAGGSGGFPSPALHVLFADETGFAGAVEKQLDR